MAFIILYIIFGILPSIAWLSFYLRKDQHPESNKMVFLVFLWGAFATLPTFLLQMGMAYLTSKLHLSSLAISIIYWFLIISFTEELFKYLAVRIRAFKDYEMDEPIDLMLYMIIAALGFAALENVLYLFSPFDQLAFSEILNKTMVVSFIRFLGATCLHALCSAVIGYFWARAVCLKRGWWLFATGFFAAVGLHGLYDFSIITLEGYSKFLIPIILLIITAVFTLFSFENLKKLKSICKIN